MSVHEREALEELEASAGWQYFVQRTLQETTGPGYVARMTTAMNGELADVKVVHRTMLEVGRMLQWVPNRIAELRAAE